MKEGTVLVSGGCVHVVRDQRGRDIERREGVWWLGKMGCKRQVMGDAGATAVGR